MNPLDTSTSALSQLKSAVLSYLAKFPDGRSNSELARDLRLESDFQGAQRNYLSWSILGMLVNERLVATRKVGRKRLFSLPSASRR